MLRSAIT